MEHEQLAEEIQKQVDLLTASLSSYEGKIDLILNETRPVKEMKKCLIDIETGLRASFRIQNLLKEVSSEGYVLEEQKKLEKDLQTTINRLKDQYIKVMMIALE